MRASVSKNPLIPMTKNETDETELPSFRLNKTAEENNEGRRMNLKTMRLVEHGLTKRESRRSPGRSQLNDYEILKNFIQDKFTYKECNYFKPKIESATINEKTQCCCGDLRKDHPEREVKFYNKERGITVEWKRDENIRLGKPTNAFGQIKFDGESSNLTEYIRISDEDDLNDVIKLMFDYWNFDKPSLPSLCISVIGGAKNFRLIGRKRDVFNQGLIKSAQTTGAWIITSGLNLGITKVVGEALHESQSFHYDKKNKSRRLRCLGIAPWGYVLNKEVLVNKRGEHESQPKSYKIVDKITSGEPVSLNRNHTHYIFVDDGIRRSYGGSKSAEYRARLERKIALSNEMQTTGTTADTDAEVGLGIPVVLIIVEGGHDVFIDCKNSITEHVPVVICNNTGRAADVLGFAARSFKKISQKDSKIMQQLDLLLDEVYKSGDKPLTDEEKNKFRGKKDEAIEMISIIMNDPSLITVFDMDRQRAEDFDYAILNALLKRRDGNSSAATQLKLALKWNRVDIAEQIFQKDPKIDKKDRHDCLLNAMMDDKVEFVQILLQNGIVMREFLDENILETLYKHSSSHEQFKHNLKYFLSFDDKDDVDLTIVGKLIRKLVGRFDSPLYIKDVNGVKPAEEIKITRAYTELYLWSILDCRLEMAQFMWERSDDPIFLALVGSKVYFSMLDAVPDYDSETNRLYQEYKDKCEDWAMGVLEECNRVDQDNAVKIVDKQHEYWGGLTSLEMAAGADDQRFLSSIVCQNSLDYRWTKGISLPSFTHIVCIFLPFILLIGNVAKFTKDDNNNEQKPSKWSIINEFYLAPKTKFLISLMSYLYFVFFFSYFILFDLNETISPVEIVIFIYIGALLLDEIREMFVSRADSFGEKLYDWFMFSNWNRLDLLIILSGLTSAFLRIGESNTFIYARTIYCVMALFVFVRILRLYSASSRLGPKIVMIERMIEELLYFILILSIPMFIYGVTSQALLFPNRPFMLSVLKDVVYDSFWQIFGVINLDGANAVMDGCNGTNTMTDAGDYCPQYHFMVPLLLAINLITVNILLITLLIAIFSNIFDEVQIHSIEIWKFKMFRMVVEYEHRPCLPLPLFIIEIIIVAIISLIRKCRQNNKLSPAKNENVSNRELLRLMVYENSCRNASFMNERGIQSQKIDKQLEISRKELEEMSGTLEEFLNAANESHSHHQHQLAPPPILNNPNIIENQPKEVKRPTISREKAQSSDSSINLAKVNKSENNVKETKLEKDINVGFDEHLAFSQLKDRSGLIEQMSERLMEMEECVDLVENKKSSPPTIKPPRQQEPGPSELHKKDLECVSDMRIQLNDLEDTTARSLSNIEILLRSLLDDASTDKQTVRFRSHNRHDDDSHA